MRKKRISSAVEGADFLSASGACGPTGSGYSSACSENAGDRPEACSESQLLIEADRISLSYDDSRPLLHDISFRIEPETLYCLMGANGCGKSTLINCILGNHAPDAGQIRIRGKELKRYKPSELAREISFVPQLHERTFPYTVRQIVTMGRNAYSRGFSGPDGNDAAKVEEALKKTGVLHLADRPYTQISGGEMQLVMLSRALVQEASVIIMDEPSAHLDFRNELIFLENTARLIREGLSSVVMATHSPNQPFFFERSGVNVKVLAVCDGTIELRGTPSEVLTEENIRRIYRIDSRLMSMEDPSYGVLRQIVPLSTDAQEDRGTGGQEKE